MNERISHRFHQDVSEGLSSLPWDIGYRPPLLTEAVALYGATEAARRALSAPRPSDGFIALARHGLLHRSIEAWVLHPEYSGLFADEQLAEARRRLERHGFPVDAYLHTLTPAADHPS
jgi:hypothetical protein